MKNMTIPLNFDLEQFLHFFRQLSPENKEVIFNALNRIMQVKNRLVRPDDFPLMGTVLKYDSPFDPVAEGDWELLAA